MKILMVNKFLFPAGGAQTYIFKLSDYLVSQGHEVQYFGMYNKNNCVGNAIGSYTEEIDFHNARFVDKIRYSFKIIYSREARKKIRLVLDDFQPDVVHLNNIYYHLTPSIILEIVKWREENNRRCKVVFTMHDYNLICPNHMMRNPNTNENCEKCLGGHFENCLKGKCIHGSRLRSALGTIEAFYWNNRKVYQNVDTFICCSAFMKKKMDSNPLFREKTVALMNFTDTVEAKSVEKKDYVLYFGRYSEEKGLRTLIEVCKELPNINFIFAGSGPLENQLEETKNIKNVGFQSGKELETLIREARFSVYPSEWYENCPFSIIESLMYGTPVLAADIGGIPELVVNGVNGELFESGNKAALKTHVLQLWQDKRKTEMYSSNCVKTNINDVEQYYNKLMVFYRFSTVG